MGDRSNSIRAQLASPRHPIASADRARALEQALRVVLRFFTRMGTRTLERRAAFREAERRATRQPYRNDEANRYILWSHIGDVISLWHSDPRFVGADGRPKALPLRGRGSFSDLSRRVAPRYAPNAVAEWLMAMKFVIRRADGSLLPTRRDLMYGKNRAVILERVPVLIHGLLATVGYNLARQRPPLRIECESASNLIPESLVPDFDRYTYQRGRAFVTDVDNWIAQRARLPGNLRSGLASKRQVRVSVNVFANVAPFTPSRVRKRSG